MRCPWLSVRRIEVQFVSIWSCQCYCYLQTPASFAVLKSRMVFTFLVPTYASFPGKVAAKWVFVFFLYSVNLRGEMICCVSGEADHDESAACDEQLSVSESDATDSEHRQAMLVAMESVDGCAQSATAVSAWSVEACLARFTEKETLSGVNMITCETCSRLATAAVANVADDGVAALDDNKSAASSSDNVASSSASKTSNTSGRYQLHVPVAMYDCLILKLFKRNIFRSYRLFISSTLNKPGLVPVEVTIPVGASGHHLIMVPWAT